jgi:hypothetical protein
MSWPKVGAGRRYDMRIDLDGIWHHESRPIGRKELVRLFASVLRREPDGSHWLVTPAEFGRIEVEDVPFVIVEMALEGQGADQRIHLRSNVDDWLTLDGDHPLDWRRPPPKLAQSGLIPYVNMRHGLDARLSRPVYYELAALGEEHDAGGASGYGVWSAGRFFGFPRHEDEI